MSILIGALIGFLVHSFVVVPVFMELALNKPKKTEDGRLRFKRNGFVLKYLYNLNVITKVEYKSYPNNTCQIYKGIWRGILLFVFESIILMFVMFMLYCPGAIIAIFLGFFPKNPGDFFRNTDNSPYHQYERIGSKKWIAPWKFILPIGLTALIYFFYKEIYTVLVKASVPLHSKTALIVYGSIAGLVSLIFIMIVIINKIRKTESFAAMKETTISFIKKMCKEIEVGW